MRKKKTYTIFFSWQSDTDGKERAIIEHAIKKAAQSLESEHGYKLDIDNSTLGESGMPNISQTIMRKIDDCDIFLCDLTPVRKVEKELAGGKKVIKQLPNPNVLVELGYAMSAVGINYIIPLAHQGDWSATEMPFDINHNRIISFTKDDINLEKSIHSVVEFIRTNGKHRHLDEPYWLHKLKLGWTKFLGAFEKEYTPLKIYRDPATVFSLRMAKAFPGKRGLITYTNDRDIRRCLKHLLASPLQFDKAEGYGVHTDPIWSFRGVHSLDIPSFRRLGKRRYLIGNDELRIKRITAYVDYARYYKEYVYVETLSDSQTGLYSYTKEQKAYYENEQSWTEDYAIYKLWGLIPIKVTLQEYDDGHKVILGRTVHIYPRCELRVRYIKPYNFIIAAKKSAYMCQEFERSSEPMFDGLLSGDVSISDFNQYMMHFQKPMD